MEKKIFALLTLWSLVINIHSLTAQELGNYITSINDALQTVETSKITFSQSLKLNTTNYADYTLTALDSKGKSKEILYNFSFSDVDVNTVRAITKKDAILVQLLVKGKQKLIKASENGGDKIAYVDNIAFYAKNIENGRNLVDAIKKLVPVNEKFETNKLALSTYKDHLNWLVDNIQDVDFIKTQRVQKLEAGTKNNGNIKLSTTTNAKNKNLVEEFEFNLATLNPNSLVFKISGDEFYILASTRRSIRVIKVFEDGVQQNYTDDIKFYSASIENAKDTYKVLKAIIPLAEKAFLNTKPNIETTVNAYKYVSTAIKNVANSTNTFTQTITGDCISKITVKETDIKETIEHTYNFNFGDINLDQIDYDSNKDQLFVEVNTRKQAKFIRHIENGVLQNYTNTLKLYLNSIEEAMIVKEALQNLVKNCENKSVKSKTGSISTNLEHLKNDIKLIKVGDNSYDQTFEVVNTAPYVVKLTSVFSNLKNSKETIYEFGLGDINPKTIAITTSGKYAMVELSTKHLEKIIKTYVDGEIKSYAYKIEILATDIENARRISNTLKYITNTLQK